MNKRSRFGWPTIIGLVVTVPLLWWSLRGIHFAEVWEFMRSANTLPIIGTVLSILAVYPLRAMRWRALLSHETRLPVLPLLHATLIGFAINNLLPARAGEIARAYAARKLTGVSFSSALVTIVVSRVLDGVTLFVLLAGAAAAGWLSTDAVVAGVPVGGIMRTAVWIFGLLALIGLAGIHFPNQVLGVTSKLASRLLRKSMSDSLIRTASSVLDSLAVLRSWRRLGVVMAWSFLIWGVNAMSFGLCFLAFDMGVPWYGAVVLQSLVNFGLVIPSTPGFVGVFEAVTRASLAIYGIEPGPAVSYAVAYHFCAYVPVTLLGLWSLSRARLHLSEIQAQVHDRVSGAIQRMTGRHAPIEEA
jgi:hypothetical protein